MEPLSHLDDDPSHGPRPAAADELDAGVVTALEQLVDLAIEVSGAAAGCITLAGEDRPRIVAARGGTGPTSDQQHGAQAVGVDDAAATALAGEAASGAALPGAAPGAPPPARPARAPLEFAARGRGGAVHVFGARELEPGARRILQQLAERAADLVELAAARAELAALRARCANVDAHVLEERATEGRRVGAELHAMLGYELMSSSLSLQAALPRLSGLRDDLDAIRGVAALLRNGIERWRDRVRAGYTAVPEPEGFAAALRRYSTAIGREHGIKVQLHVGANVTAQLTAVSAYHLQQLAVEAIVGAVRYSRGSLVIVDISRDADGLVLKVADDGIAVSVDWSRERQAFHEVEAMAHLLRGDLQVRPRRPGGLSVEVRLPDPSAGAADVDPAACAEPPAPAPKARRRASAPPARRRRQLLPAADANAGVELSP